MKEIEKYIEELKEKYGDKVVINKRTCNDELLNEVPEPLREFYSIYDGIELPFGEIDSIECAIKHSNEAEPFKSEGWFCFGFDGYFSYWLCSYEKDDKGLCITSWDHDTDSEIEGAYSDIIEFLKDMEDEFEENEWD